MSVSKAQLEDFASKINTHPAYDEVMTRISQGLFERWVKATEDQRKIIGDIVAIQGQFIDEINKVCGQIDADKPVNDESNNDE
jgi:carbamoylphosphate synthase large subunit